MKRNDIIYNYEPLWQEWYVEKLLGKGSYGSVYKINREGWGHKQTSAVKVIPIIPSPDDMLNLSLGYMGEKSLKEYYEDIVQNVIKEIELLYKLKGNSYIVSYEDHMVRQSEKDLEWIIFIRMEYLTSLSHYILQNSLKLENIIQLGIDICSGLEVCKNNNIIHRDIKEANIFVTANGTYKIGDFGISKELLNTTKIASIKGTPYYMAPETFKDNKYDERVDIYALGLVLYKLLNHGRMPFLPPYPEQFTGTDREKSFEDRIKGKTFNPPYHANDNLSKIILKACSYNPDDRFLSAKDMKKELLNLLDITPDEIKNKVITLQTIPLSVEDTPKETAKILDNNHPIEKTKLTSSNKKKNDNLKINTPKLTNLNSHNNNNKKLFITLGIFLILFSITFIYLIIQYTQKRENQNTLNTSATNI